MGKLCGLLLLFRLLWHCDAYTQAESITGVMATMSELSILYSAVRIANLNFILEGVGPFTVFAPTNDAFRLLGPGITATLTKLENTAYLTQVLQYHVCYGDTPSQQLLQGQDLSTFQGDTLSVTSITPFVVNDIPISRQDLSAANGLIHTIREVMMPPNFQLPAPTMSLVELVKSESYLSSLAQAIEQTGLESALSESPLTVLMPTNEAFTNLSNGILESLLLPPNLDKLRQVVLHHVLDGNQDTTKLAAGNTMMTKAGGQILITQTSPLKVDSLSMAISTDVPATNGVLHVVDTVILPSGFVYPDKNLLQLVEGSPSLSIFAAAIRAAGLESTLSGRFSGDSRYTMFAPTNDAFEALGIGVASSLLMPANEVKLRQVLRYHLLSGAFQSFEFTANVPVQTLEQSLVKIGSVRPLVVDNARALSTDVPATNGIIHMLSGVLLPVGFRFPDKNVMQLADSTDSLSTFNSLVQLAGLTETLANTGPYTIFAPTNAAFALLGEDTLQELRQSDKRELLQILKYHVINGKIDSTRLRYGRDIATLEGSFITVKPWTELGWQGIAYESLQPPVTMNMDVEVSTENALATNGIAHFVNKVLVPPGVELGTPAAANSPATLASSCETRQALLGLVLLLWYCQA